MPATNHPGTSSQSTQENMSPVGLQQQEQLLPCGDLLEDRNKYFEVCVPLYNASLRGDWEAAQVIFARNSSLDLVGCAITENYETALHIAASAKSSKVMQNFVQKLVKKMRKEQLQLLNNNSYTSLTLAAAAGNVEIAKIMLTKNPNLLEIPGIQKSMPLYWASIFGKEDMIKYLYPESNYMKGDIWENDTRCWVLEKCVAAEMFDVALHMVDLWGNIIVIENVLEILASKTDAFNPTKASFIRRKIRRFFAAFYVKAGPAEKTGGAVQLLRIIWAQCLRNYNKDDVDQILSGLDDTPTDPSKEDVEQLLGTISEKITKLHDSLHIHWNTPGFATPAQNRPQVQPSNNNYSFRILFSAAEMGNTRFLVELLHQNPDLIWKTNEQNQTIFHVAVSYRHHDIFNLLQEIGSMKEMITAMRDDNKNNMLHLAGKIANEKRLQVVSGVALQMHRELLWFKQVEAMVPSSYREDKNKDGLTPHELFSKEHKALMSAGEEWMKGTANQSMVVAALITTIVFAAAFTIPGGYNQDKGVPIFLHNRAFIVFVISDAFSLTCSSISILIFLSILTSRYAEDDFLYSLPWSLLFGLGTLFLSIASMMVAFSGSFFVLYKNNLIWVPIVICGIASLPVFFYLKLQYKLLMDVYYSTSGYRNLFKQKQFMAYDQNP